MAQVLTTTLNLDNTDKNPLMATKIEQRRHRRVVAATTVGTAIEWYDFFLYAASAALVFNQLYFAGFGGGAATIVSFLTVGLSFLFRPLGAFLAGYFGDKYGRRVVLMVTLFGMGTATTAIGLLPTAAQIGVWAPIILVLLRIVQGVSAGGEWGGAALMAVEHAPTHRRGLFGSGPQTGTPAGLLMSSAAMGIMAVIAPGDDFLAWGWRVPFLLSIVLVFVGYGIRIGVDESPVFAELNQRREERSAAPIGELFRQHWPIVLVAALVFAGNSAVGYMMAGGYIQNYASDPAGPVGLPRDEVLFGVALCAALWLVACVVAGFLSDAIGRRSTYILGFLAQGVAVWTLFPLVDRGTFGGLVSGLGFLTIGLALTLGQQPAMYAELFPASVRFSGVSISYAIGAVVGGAFAPTIAAAIYEATGQTLGISVYLTGMTLVGLLAVLVLRDRRGIPLGPRFEAEQRRSPLRWPWAGA